MRIRRASVVIVAAVMASACGSTPSNSPTPQNGDAWKTVLGHIGKDGSVDTQTALGAFSLAIGPLPGVTTPTGVVRQIADGSGPVRWAIGHLGDMSTDQKAAVLHYLESSSAATATTNMQVAQLSYAVNDVTVSQLTTQVNAAAVTISGRLHRPALPISVALNTVTPTTDPERTAQAYTLPMDASHAYVGPATTCRVSFNPLVHSMPSGEVGLLVFHEVFHCFEASAFPTVAVFGNTLRASPWVIEGAAEFAGADLASATSGPDAYWTTYLTTPFTGLFQRSYDALGFYSALRQFGSEPWDHFDDMFHAAPGGNMAAYGAIVASSETSLLDGWATTFLRKPSFGAAWDAVGPAITTDAYMPTPEQIGNGAIVGGPVAPLANDIEELHLSADVVSIGVTDHAHLQQDPSGISSTTPSGDYCVRSGGCTCPPDSVAAAVPTTPLPAGMYYLAVGGGRGGGTWSIEGNSLDDFCNRDPVERCVQGSWHQTSSLWTSTEAPVFRDTGPFNDIYSFSRNAVTDNFDPSPRIYIIDGDLSFKAMGTARASVTARGGVMRFTNVDFTGVSFSEDGPGGGSIQYQFTDVAGAGFHEGTASYTCSPTTLVINFPEPATSTFAKNSP